MSFEKICTVVSDIGSVRLRTSDVAFLLRNGRGDGYTHVFLKENDTSISPDLRFIDSFSVYTEAYITRLDCGYTKSSMELVYKLKRGHYFAYNYEGDVFLVRKEI
jgi:hypothetical protein